MRGVILAGGTGSRLAPLTVNMNKHVLPVGRSPMIAYPLVKLKQAGVNQVLIVTNALGAFQIASLYGNGKRLGMELTFKIQEEAGGIADALGLAADFVGRERFIVLLGDNIFQDDLTAGLARMAQAPKGALVYLKAVANPEGYGVADLQDGRIVGIEEKPANPKSHYCVTGIYIYDARVFGIIESLVPSTRGELEITDVNNAYIARGELAFEFLHGWWIDAGTFENLALAGQYVQAEV